MYFCNARCLCIWAFLFVTKPNKSEAQRDLAVEMTAPTGQRREFAHALDLAQGAAANALHGKSNPWITKGTQLTDPCDPLGDDGCCGLVAVHLFPAHEC